MIWKCNRPNFIYKSFLSILILYSSTIKAQVYFPLVDTSSVWMEGIGYDGGSPPYGDIEQYTI